MTSRLAIPISQIVLTLGLTLSFSCRTVSPNEPSEFAPTAQDRIVPKDAKLELVWSEGRFTEGPAAAPDGTILFSDIGNNRIMRYFPDRNTHQSSSSVLSA